METFYDQKDNIWRGPQLVLSGDQPTNVAEVCLKALMKDPDHIAQICYPSGKEYTNREIAEMSIRVAQHFRDYLKLSQGEIIGLCAFNSDYVVPLFYGGLLAGLPINTIDPRVDKDAIKHVFSLTKPSIMFCDGDMYPVIKNIIDELQLAITIYTLKSHIANVPTILEFLREHSNIDTFKPDALKEGRNQTALLLCSSGTTGKPKAVSISHAAIFHHQVRKLQLKTALCFSTLHWVSGVAQVIYTTLQNVTNVISERAFSTSDFFAIVEKYKIESIIAPPSQLALLVADPHIRNSDLSSIRVIMCGGGLVPVPIVDNLKQYVPTATIMVGYGLTEGGGCSIGIGGKENCVGRLLANVEVKILDENGKRLGPNEKGEICMKTPNPWAGYYNKPEETAATLIDGWIHTGDIGFFDDDNFLFVVDRKKEILKYNNFHVSPSEIEQIIYTIKGVAETCVFGIPDFLGNDLLAAAVVLIPGCQLTDTEIIDHVAAHTTDHQRLRAGVYFLNELPKTSTGKVIRRQVLNICQQM